MLKIRALAPRDTTTHVGTAAPGCPAAQVYRAAAGSYQGTASAVPLRPS
jgi:hypothetical protein